MAEVTMPPGLPNRVEVLEARADDAEARLDTIEATITAYAVQLGTIETAITTAIEARRRWWEILKGAFR